jgi:hypothetical protein
MSRRGDIIVGNLGERPEHAAKLGIIVSLSAMLESQLGHLLALMSGGSASITVALFQAVTSASAQRAMLARAAERRLSPEDNARFKQLMDQLRAGYKERSGLVHGLWGTSDAYPEDAIWIPADAMADRHAGAMGSYEPAEGLAAIVRGMRYLDECRVYTVADLQQVADRVHACVKLAGAFSTELAARHPVLGMPPIPEPETPPQNE